MNYNLHGFFDEASANIDLQIASMKQNGAKGLEIRNVDGQNISDISVEKAKEVKEKLDFSGFFVWSLGSPIGKINIETDDFSKHLDKFKHTLQIADILNTDNIRLFSFYIPNGKNPADYKNEVIERMATFAEIAKGTGITLCHENEKGIYGDIGSRCLDILQAVPSICGVFDPANFVQSGEDTLRAWAMLKPYIKYMHIKDALLDGSVVPAGKGDGNVKQIVSEFLKLGGKDFSMEPHLRVFSGLSDLERENEKSLVGKYTYKSGEEAFVAAVAAFRKLIEEETVCK